MWLRIKNSDYENLVNLYHVSRFFIDEYNCVMVQFRNQVTQALRQCDNHEDACDNQEDALKILNEINAAINKMACHNWRALSVDINETFFTDNP